MLVVDNGRVKNVLVFFFFFERGSLASASLKLQLAWALMFCRRNRLFIPCTCHSQTGPPAGRINLTSFLQMFQICFGLSLSLCSACFFFMFAGGFYFVFYWCNFIDRRADGRRLRSMVFIPSKGWRLYSAYSNLFSSKVWQQSMNAYGNMYYLTPFKRQTLQYLCALWYCYDNGKGWVERNNIILLLKKCNPFPNTIVSRSTLVLWT